MLDIRDISDYIDNIIETYNYDFKQCNAHYFNAKDTKIMCITESKQQLYKDDYFGSPCTYKTLDTSLLIHYSKDYYETLEEANKIYEYFDIMQYVNDNLEIGNNKVHFIKVLSRCEDIGQDENKIFERVIRLRFFYSEKNKE